MVLENAIDKCTNSRPLRGIITRRKRADLLFAVVGLFAMLVALVVLLALLGQLAFDGICRLSWQFLTSYPSRFPAQAGILSAWIGTILVILLTALTAVPLGLGPRSTSRSMLRAIG